MLKVPYASWLFSQLGKWPLKEGEGSTGHLLGFINMPEQGISKNQRNSTFTEFILPLSTTLKGLGLGVPFNERWLLYAFSRTGILSNEEQKLTFISQVLQSKAVRGMGPIMKDEDEDEG